MNIALEKLPEVKCQWCRKTGGEIKWYVVAEENLMPYHPECYDNMIIEAMEAIWPEASK